MPPVGPPEPEFLEQGGGSQLRPGRPSTWRVRPVVWAMAGVLVLGLGAVGAWAAFSFFRTGPQPAEALPASTLAYASVDLDPSGEQKIAAVRLLRKFPAIRDEIGLDSTDDLRRVIFEEIQQDTGACADLDYATDVEPWLGDRMAVAAVDTGADEPTAVAVLQVSDESAADDALGVISDCAGSGDNAVGWAVTDGWALLAETSAVAQQVADDAASASLADDDEFRSWGDKVGDPGIINLYASAELGPVLARELGSAALGTGQLPDAFDAFGGLAGAVRFQGSALELEFVGEGKQLIDSLGAGDRGADVVRRLPVDTALALGVGFDEGWLTSALANMSGSEGRDLDAMLAQITEQTGLEVPADLETLTGESMAISVGSSFDLEKLMNSASFKAPIAWTVDGDAAAVEEVLARVTGRVGPLAGRVLGSDSAEGLTAIGPDADYRAQVLAGGKLGDMEAFREVLPEAERASGLFFVNFDAGGGWLARLASGDATVLENVEPLRAFGASSWRDGTTLHARVRLTTD